tara:strand:+ start:537 stop:1076 length:540 start_codon:yes stop_codon:yes gene_type:complete
MAATTIRDFFQSAQARQFSRDFHFRVISIDLAGGVSFSGDDQLVYARAANLPGRAIQNKVANYYGQQFNIPGKSEYTNSEAYSIEFYHDEDCDLRSQFEEASRAVFNDTTSTGDYAVPGTGDVINLQVIDRQLNRVKDIKLVGASIRDIGEVSYQIADGTGEVTTIPVTFSYHFYDEFD